MALDTDFTDIADKIKEVILELSDDLNIREVDVYLFEAVQNYRVPAVFVEFLTAGITRMSPHQGQWKIRWLLTIVLQDQQRGTRQTLLFNVLATLIKKMMKNPSVKGSCINVEVEESSVDRYGGDGADQVANGASFIMTVYQEPVNIQAVEVTP